MSTSGTSAFSGVGLTDPTLSFGVTGISDWSTETPFLDLMKTSRPWIGHNGNVWSAMTTDQLAGGGYLDAEGWPTQIPQGLTSIGTIWAWGNSASDPAAAASRAGVYVLTYEGEGTMKLSGDMRVLSSEPGRILVENRTGGQMILDITATDPNHTGNYIRNLSLVPQKFEALHDAGEIFNPDWLAVVQDARELRFMDWMQTNGTIGASWEDRPEVGDVSYMTNGVPVEVMVQLANQTGTEPWFNMPAGADEAYIRNFATYVRDHLNPDLTAHVEYSNETWNWAFTQTKWMLTQAQTVWNSTDGAAYLDYNAMLATKSALIWDDVFGASADARVDNVLATQTAKAWNASRLLTAPLWAAKDPTGYVDPSTVFDSLAVTTYFGGATLAQTALRDELLAKLGTTGAEATTVWLAAKLMDPAYAQSIPQIESWWANNKAVADKYGLDLVAYEGGQHVLQSFAISGMSDADLATLTQFLSGFVRSEAMATLYHELWTAWAKVSDGPFMQFGDVSAASKYGAWGIFSALGDGNPRADLLMDLNAHQASWFGDGGGERYQQGVIKVAGDAGEILVGTDKDDFLIGGNGRDTIIAGRGHDAISGGDGRDVLILEGDANDYSIAAEGDGYRLTGPGTSHFLKDVETFQFDDGVTIGLNALRRLSDGSIGRTLSGTSADNVLVGGAGDDTIMASLGNDTIIGGDGRDTLVLGGREQDYLLVTENTGFRLTGGSASGFLQGIEQFSFGDGTTKTLDELLTQSPIDPGPLHLAVPGVRADALDVALVQVDMIDGRGASIYGINPRSELGQLLGLDPNSVLGEYVVASTTARATFGGESLRQNYWTLQENQVDRDTPDALTENALTTALRLGSVVTSVHAISGTAANDRFLGQGADDVFNGGGGNDVIYGRRGNDVLLGGAGNDKIIGGIGDDTMTGGTGNDRFYLSKGDGHDKIMDFGHEDTLDLIGHGIASHDMLMAMAGEDATGNLTLTKGQDIVTLVGLHVSDLSWMDIAI